jgi:6-phosphogluconolactonase/glucosamine-6-phosphate isomerase/deaminase
MDLISCKTHDEIVERAHLWCESRVKSCGAQSIFLPAGNTPTALFKFWEKTKPSFLQGKRLLQVDDVITGKQQGMFRRYFEDNLPSYKHQLQKLETGDEVADLAILGFGINGHVAFHEPGIPKDFFSGCLPLSEESKKTLSLEPDAWGLTYGLGAFLKTKAVLLIVTGEKKRPMFERFQKETDTFPAACLKAHRDLTVLVDF